MSSHLEVREIKHTLVIRNALLRVETVIKYLGVMLDNKLTSKFYIRRVADKAVMVKASLSRVMTNDRDLRQCKRHLCMCTAESVM